MKTRTYSTLAEATQREVVEPIENGDIEDAYAEFDIDSIAAEVLGGINEGYALKVDTDTFWGIVEKYAK